MQEEFPDNLDLLDPSRKNDTYISEEENPYIDILKEILKKKEVYKDLLEEQKELDGFLCDLQDLRTEVENTNSMSSHSAKQIDNLTHDFFETCLEEIFFTSFNSATGLKPTLTYLDYKIKQVTRELSVVDKKLGDSFDEEISEITQKVISEKEPQALEDDLEDASEKIVKYLKPLEEDGVKIPLLDYPVIKSKKINTDNLISLLKETELDLQKTDKLQDVLQDLIIILSFSLRLDILSLDPIVRYKASEEGLTLNTIIDSILSGTNDGTDLELIVRYILEDTVLDGLKALLPE